MKFQIDNGTNLSETKFETKPVFKYEKLKEFSPVGWENKYGSQEKINPIVKTSSKQIQTMDWEKMIRRDKLK